MITWILLIRSIIQSMDQLGILNQWTKATMINKNKFTFKRRLKRHRTKTTMSSRHWNKNIFNSRTKTRLATISTNMKNWRKISTTWRRVSKTIKNMTLIRKTTSSAIKLQLMTNCLLTSHVNSAKPVDMTKQEFLQELVMPNDPAIWSYKWTLIHSSMHQVPEASNNRTIDIWTK